MFRSAIDVLIIFLLIVWFMGTFISPVESNLIHALLVIVVVAAVIRFTRGRKAA